MRIRNKHPSIPPMKGDKGGEKVREGGCEERRLHKKEVEIVAMKGQR